MNMVEILQRFAKRLRERREEEEVQRGEGGGCGVGEALGCCCPPTPPSYIGIQGGAPISS